MNSINFKFPAADVAPRSWETVAAAQEPSPATDAASFRAMSQLRASASQQINPKQRIVGILGALVLQAGLAIALIFGTEIKAVLRPPPLTMVSVIEEVQQLKPVEPPPPPRMIAPDLHVVTLPPMPVIMAAPPPAPLPPSPTAITMSNTAEPLTPPVAVVESYQVRLLRYLASYRRYPAAARARHQEGVVFVRFAMDRHGNVLSSEIEKRSRFAALNEEALTVFKRANPLPAPPPELAGDPLLLVMPVEFSLR